MSFEYNKINQAQNRPMTSQERLGFLVFLIKFFFSKFGVFLFFLSLNFLPFSRLASQNLNNRKIEFQVVGKPTITLGQNKKSDSNENLKVENRAKIPLAAKNELGVITNSETHGLSCDILPESRGLLKRNFSDLNSSRRQEQEKLIDTRFPVSASRSIDRFLRSKNRNCEAKNGSSELEIFNYFQKLKKYCIIATIVTLFLNPQQTKYFGGLAVVLKQAGFFSKYSKSEKTVYILSWVFIFVFFYSSYFLARSSQQIILSNIR